MDENRGAGRQATSRRLWPGAAGALANDEIARGPMGQGLAGGRLPPMDGAGGRPMDEAAGEARAERKNNLDSGLSG